MIMSVWEFRTWHETDESDQMIQSRLNAVESVIRAYTNNHFHVRGFRQDMTITDGRFQNALGLPYRAGDTIHVSGSLYNDGVYTIHEVTGETFCVEEALNAMDDIGVVDLVRYPADVKTGAVGLMKWDMERREKVGVSSETISRHSVTYANMDGENTAAGYPASLMAFLNPYKRARFGDRG